MPSKLGNTTWYTVQETADCLGKSYNTVAARLKAGEIPYSEVGGSKVIAHEDLVKALGDANLPESIIEYRLGIKPIRKKKATEQPLAES